MLSDFFRFCAVCGFMFPPVHWLCNHCWTHLRNQYLPHSHVYRIQKKFPHLRLMDWKTDNFFLLKPFLNSLKGEGSEVIFDELAKESFARFSNTKAWSFFKNPTFVPAPSRFPFKKDHAGLFAEALSFYFGGDVRFVLDYGSKASSQKSKNRLERSKKTFRSSENLENQSIVFVDDVLTTGFTARAAYVALNRPQKFMICTLAWRQPPDTINLL